MSIAGNFLLAFAQLTNTLLTIYFWIIVARAILSWVSPDPYNPIVHFLYRATEPVLFRIRRLLPAMGGLDLAPIIVLLLIQFLQSFAVRSVMELAYQIKSGGVISP
jgi:YggT family protein